MVRQRPQSCEGCVLHAKGTDFSRPEGKCSLGVAVIAEASGEMEARDQLPLRPYAPAGSLLERTFRRMGYSRDQFVLSNIIRCRPPNNFLAGAPWEFPAIRQCRPNLDKLLADYQPRAILALGDTALRELSGECGEARGVGHLCGYVLRGPGDVPTIPAWHPAFIRRGNARLQGLFSRNLQRAVNVASGEGPIVDMGFGGEHKHDGRIRYHTHPSLDEARSFA